DLCGRQARRRYGNSRPILARCSRRDAELLAIFRRKPRLRDRVKPRPSLRISTKKKDKTRITSEILSLTSRGARLSIKPRICAAVTRSVDYVGEDSDGGVGLPKLRQEHDCAVRLQ